MSNKIHQELCRIAKEILEAEKPSDYQKIYDQTLLLFEQLILIKNSKGFEIDFWEDLESKFDKEIDFIEIQDKKDLEEQIENNDRQELPPLIDTIKEIVKEIPEPQPAAEDFLKVSHQELKFEPKEEELDSKKETPIERLNDKFSKGLQIDLNDRLAFIKHLFDQNPNDYQRAVSQISTFQNWNQAKEFILEMIKPDYDNWKGKELYEARFLKIVENNFQ